MGVDNPIQPVARTGRERLRTASDRSLLSLCISYQYGNSSTCQTA
jgi:hypothetical protein